MLVRNELASYEMHSALASAILSDFFCFSPCILFIYLTCVSLLFQKVIVYTNLFRSLWIFVSQKCEYIVSFLSVPLPGGFSGCKKYRLFAVSTLASSFGVLHPDRTFEIPLVLQRTHLCQLSRATLCASLCGGWSAWWGSQVLPWMSDLLSNLPVSYVVSIRWLCLRL